MIYMQLLGQSKEKINLFLLLLGISQERFWGLQNIFLTTVEELKWRLFLHNTNHVQSHQWGSKYPLLLSFWYPRKNQRYECTYIIWSILTTKSWRQWIQHKMKWLLKKNYSNIITWKMKTLVLLINYSESDSDYDI